MNLLTIITILPTILNLLTSLMKISEEIFGDGTGEFKKEWVLKSVSEFIPMMEKVSTGGQKDTWATIGEGWEVLHTSVGNAIDFMAGVLFPHK